MKQVHIVPHVHWDREWYFTAEESRILLVNNMEEILEILESEENYPWYVLDGQTAILEDYFVVKPENKERVKRLVQTGKLIIGPWYSQTDVMVVGGESVVRNLLYGMKDCAEFGEPMKIGYLPDSFGQSSQLPQIYQGFDIAHTIFWRGVSERHGTNKTEFYWQSDNGDKVLVQLFPLGYAIGKYLPTEPKALQARMDKYFGVLDRGATTEHIILPNGHDQMPIQKNIFAVMDTLREVYPERQFLLSRYEHVLEEIAKQTDLATLHGEFIDGKYMRVHRSIFSTRMDIKAANARIENKITNILEPLAAIAYSLGFEYHSGLIELIWKLIMKNHAHDSIGCCCSDGVHREIMSRFWTAEDKVDTLITFYKRKIADALPQDKGLDKLVMYNCLPYVREEVIEAAIITKWKNFKLVDDNEEEQDFVIVNQEIIDPGLIDRQIVHYGNYDPFVKYTLQFKDSIPAMGYKAYYVREADVMVEQPATVSNQIDTDFYQITVNNNGTLHVVDKKQNCSFDQVFLLEDMADDGDEYDYSPLPGEQPILSDKVSARYELRQGCYFSYIDIDYILVVPQDLVSRKEQRFDTNMRVKLQITIPMNSPLLEVAVTIDNTVKDHRVRLYLPTGLESNFSIADNQFGHIQRPVIDSAMEVWETEGWDERPDSIYPMLSYVGVSNDIHGVAVLTNSTREYEIIGEKFDTIAITLFRSIGYLGKEELLRRPGRPSGIKLATPDSQLLGSITLQFAVLIHQGTTLTANVAGWAKEYLAPIVTYNKMLYNAMKLNDVDFKVPFQYSLLTYTGGDVVLSAIKKSEAQNGLILRFFNPSNATTTARFQLPQGTTEAFPTNLAEQALPEASYEWTGGEFTLKVKKNEARTVFIALSPDAGKAVQQQIRGE